MTPSQPLDEDSLQDATTEQIHSALFHQLVTGHAQMAVMFLGRTPNPQTGQTEVPNLEAAKMFIDQLEMLDAKTKGNLEAREIAYLSQTLTTLRLLFVEVLGESNKGSAPKPAEPADGGSPTPGDGSGGDGSPPRFSKSYGS